MKLKKRKPCKECPFRKTAPRGWLGFWSVNTILQQVHSEAGLTCHLEAEKPSLKKLGVEGFAEKSHICVGSIIHANKTCKRYHTPELAGMQEELRGSEETDNVLGLEFKKHHESCTITDEEFHEELKNRKKS
jgi:hypothetical protein